LVPQSAKSRKPSTNVDNLPAETKRLRERVDVVTSKTIGLTSSAEKIFDYDALFERVEQDLDLLQEMVELFIDSSPQLLKEIETAVANGDGPMLAHSAHTLNGALQNMCAERCARIAQRLEACGQQCDIVQAGPLLEDLQDEWQPLQSALKENAQEAHS
jgi:HPt (histidine-containing phosphotransfer) domain-containing protein